MGLNRLNTNTEIFTWLYICLYKAQDIKAAIQCSAHFTPDFCLLYTILLTHLHHKALFMGATRLCRQLVFQAAALLVQLHHRVLAIFC